MGGRKTRGGIEKQEKRPGWKINERIKDESGRERNDLKRKYIAKVTSMPLFVHGLKVLPLMTITCLFPNEEGSCER